MEIAEGFKERYATFLTHYELNPNKLADSLGDKAKVKYHRYYTGETEPGLSTMQMIASKYPISLDWLILGRGSMLRGEMTKTLGTPTPEPPRPADAVNWKEMYYEAQDRYNNLEAKFNVILEQVKGLTSKNQMLEFMYRKLDPSFQSTSSQSTAAFDIDDIIAQYKEKGLEIARESCRVDGFESSKVLEDRILNSRQSKTILRDLWPTEQAAMSA